MEDVQTFRLAPRFCGRRLSAEDAVPDEWSRPNTSIADRERSYSLRMTRHRNHQAWFTKHVRSVYGYRCAFSNLPLGKLLVGAHIKADEEGGPASASNGICMSTKRHMKGISRYFDRTLSGVASIIGDISSRQ